MARSVTIKKRSETATIELRCGNSVLGGLRNVTAASGESATMVGQFTHSPAFADHSDRFLALATALRTGDTAAVATLQAEIEAAGVHVYHAQHEMRIDRPGSVQVIGGEVSFSPSDGYLMMRTGGL